MVDWITISVNSDILSSLVGLFSATLLVIAIVYILKEWYSNKVCESDYKGGYHDGFNFPTSEVYHKFKHNLELNYSSYEGGYITGFEDRKQEMKVWVTENNTWWGSKYIMEEFE